MQRVSERSPDQVVLGDRLRAGGATKHTLSRVLYTISIRTQKYMCFFLLRHRLTPEKWGVWLASPVRFIILLK